MTIADLELLAIQTPAAPPAPGFRSVLVRLAAANGCEGWSEARLAWTAGEMRMRRRGLPAVLIGRGVFEVEELLTLEELEPEALRAAVEAASWDLIGRCLGEPLSHLWGGQYRRRVPLAARLPDVPPPQAASLARELADGGCGAVIVPACGDVEDDLAAVLAARRSAAGRCELWLDGGNRYDLPSAIRLAQELPRDAVRWWIDPLADFDPATAAELRRRTPARVAALRAIDTPRAVFQLAAEGAADAVLIDPARVGGLTRARRCAVVAEAAGLAAGLAAESGIGLSAAALAHVAAATPALALGLAELDSAWRDEVLTEPLARGDGQLAVPTGPGLGVELDRARLDRWVVA